MENMQSERASLLASFLLPLIFAQFVCSYAGSAMNVAVANVAHDLGKNRVEFNDGEVRAMEHLEIGSTRLEGRR